MFLRHGRKLGEQTHGTRAPWELHGEHRQE